MKLKCGLSREEKRVLLRDRVHSYLEWHDHFAWWPVRVASGDCRWLETVERRYAWANLSCIFNEVLAYGVMYRAKEKTQFRKEDLH